MRSYADRLEDGFNMMDDEYDRPLSLDQKLTFRDASAPDLRGTYKRTYDWRHDKSIAVEQEDGSFTIYDI